MNSFTTTFTRMKEPALKYGVCVYGTIVAYGFLKGSWAGWVEYSKWLAKRSEITIKSEFYDSIINVCRDVGVWGFHIMYGGFGSALITATAPISVPLLTLTSEEKVKESVDGDNIN